MQVRKVKRIVEEVLKQYGEYDKVIAERKENWKVELRMELTTYDKAYEALSDRLREEYKDWILEPYGGGIFNLYRPC